SEHRQTAGCLQSRSAALGEYSCATGGGAGNAASPPDVRASLRSSRVRQPVSAHGLDFNTLAKALDQRSALVRAACTPGGNSEAWWLALSIHTSVIHSRSCSAGS